MTPKIAHTIALQNLHRDLEARTDDASDPPQTSASYLRDFALRGIHSPPDFPIDKLARWVGFIQGVMASRGWLSVQAERDRTRSLFTTSAVSNSDAKPE